MHTYIDSPTRTRNRGGPPPTPVHSATPIHSATPTHPKVARSRTQSSSRQSVPEYDTGQGGIGACTCDARWRWWSCRRRPWIAHARMTPSPWRSRARPIQYMLLLSQRVLYLPGCHRRGDRVPRPDGWNGGGLSGEREREGLRSFCICCQTSVARQMLCAPPL